MDPDLDEAARLAAGFSHLLDRWLGDPPDRAIRPFRAAYRHLGPAGRLLFRAKVRRAVLSVVPNPDTTVALEAWETVNHWFPRAPKERGRDSIR